MICLVKILNLQNRSFLKNYTFFYQLIIIMNTKISIFLFALLLSSSTVFYSCTSEKEKTGEDTAEVVEEAATTDVEEMSAELKKEREELKKEWAAKIEKMDARLAELDAKIAEKGDKSEAELKERREVFHKEYAEFKADVEKAGREYKRI